MSKPASFLRQKLVWIIGVLAIVALVVSTIEFDLLNLEEVQESIYAPKVEEIPTASFISEEVTPQPIEENSNVTAAESKEIQASIKALRDAKPEYANILQRSLNNSKKRIENVDVALDDLRLTLPQGVLLKTVEDFIRFDDSCFSLDHKHSNDTMRIYRCHFSAKYPKGETRIVLQDENGRMIDYFVNDNPSLYFAEIIDDVLAKHEKNPYVMPEIKEPRLKLNPDNFKTIDETEEQTQDKALDTPVTSE